MPSVRRRLKSDIIVALPSHGCLCGMSEAATGREANVPRLKDIEDDRIGTGAPVFVRPGFPELTEPELTEWSQGVPFAGYLMR